MPWDKVPPENEVWLARMVADYPDAEKQKMFGCPVYFFGGNKSADLYHLDLMRHYERLLASFRFVPVAAAPVPQWKGQSGLVTEAVERSCGDLHGHEAYLCGSPGMIDACIAVLERLGVDPAKMYYDKYA